MIGNEPTRTKKILSGEAISGLMDEEVAEIVLRYPRVTTLVILSWNNRPANETPFSLHAWRMARQAVLYLHHMCSIPERQVRESFTVRGHLFWLRRRGKRGDKLYVLAVRARMRELALTARRKP